MKKITLALLIILIPASWYMATTPVVEVRYSSSDATIICYSELEYTMPEGCGSTTKLTVAQTWAQILVVLSSIGLAVIGLITVIQMLRRGKVQPGPSRSPHAKSAIIMK